MSGFSGQLSRWVKRLKLIGRRATDQDNVNKPGHSSFTDWLRGEPSASEDRRYRHRRLDERMEVRAEILDDLRSFVDKAHEDARRHLRELAATSLDPLQESPARDPTAGYPALLHMNTLKEYFGEVLAGLICEHFGPLNETGWSVPAYLFRFHEVAFQELDRIRQTGHQARPMLGRTGNDCLAFVRNTDGEIVRTLFCEAKCTSGHDSHMVGKAHRQLSDPLVTPLDLRQVIDVLKHRDTWEACEWIEALQRLWLLPPDHNYERCDLVSYTCGQSPVIGTSWIPCDAPHEMYTARRRLEAVEIHRNDVEALITEVYGRAPSAASD